MVYVLFDLTNNGFFVKIDVTFREDLFLFEDYQSSVPHVFLPVSPDSHGNSFPSTTTSDTGEDISPSLDHHMEQPTASKVVDSTLPGVVKSPLPFTDHHSIAAKRSFRTRQTRISMKDFITSNAHMTIIYFIINHVSFNGVFPGYQTYLAAFSIIVEHTTFEEAVKDPRWMEAMKSEIAALEDNHT